MWILYFVRFSWRICICIRVRNLWLIKNKHCLLKIKVVKSGGYSINVVWIIWINDHLISIWKCLYILFVTYFIKVKKANIITCVFTWTNILEKMLKISFRTLLIFHFFFGYKSTFKTWYLINYFVLSCVFVWITLFFFVNLKNVVDTRQLFMPWFISCIDPANKVWSKLLYKNASTKIIYFLLVLKHKKYIIKHYKAIIHKRVWLFVLCFLCILYWKYKTNIHIYLNL